ncbi:MAG: hypothetical protein V3V45_03265 [Candidatus Brocadiales bacterium]
MNKTSGFSIIEIAIVIGIVAVLAGVLTPLTFKLIAARKERAARDELEVLKEAIIGKATSTEHGEEFTFGFIGDIGNVPASLDRLKTIGSLPAYSYDSTKGMGAGWNGPYIMEKFSGDFKDDPWGTDYSYSTTGGTNTDLGVEYLATITSAGPDHTLSTSDDLSVQILEPEVRSEIVGYVRDTLGDGVRDVTVTINYPSNGALTTAPATTDDEGRYEFLDLDGITIPIPIGDRIITIDPAKLVYKPGTAKTLTDDRDDVQFKIENFSDSNISISSIKVDYTVSPAAYYEKVIIGGVTVYTYSGTRPGNGTTVTFGAASVSASTVAKQPFLARIQAGRVETPDITVDRLVVGGSLTIELQDFVDADSGGSAVTVDMTGIPLTVTFDDGSEDGSVARFIPVKGI